MDQLLQARHMADVPWASPWGNLQVLLISFGCNVEHPILEGVIPSRWSFVDSSSALRDCGLLLRIRLRGGLASSHG
jgi:hypothetical protein